MMNRLHHDRSLTPVTPAPRPTDGVASPSGFSGGKHASRNPASAPKGEGYGMPSLREIYVKSSECNKE
jgi:hypothetical protein